MHPEASSKRLSLGPQQLLPVGQYPLEATRRPLAAQNHHSLPREAVAGEGDRPGAVANEGGAQPWGPGQAGARPCLAPVVFGGGVWEAQQA
jgi:hypothetical protein